MANMKKEINLYASYRRGAREKSGGTWLRGYYMPVFVLTVAVLLAWAVIVRLSVDVQTDIDAVNAYLTAPATEAQYEQSVEKQDALSGIRAALAEVRTLTDSLGTYPAVDETVVRAIGAAGGSAVTTVLRGYDSATGALDFEASSAEVIDIPSYVLSLEQTGLFERVGYGGYSYQDGRYELTLSCVLKGGAAS